VVILGCLGYVLRSLGIVTGRCVSCSVKLRDLSGVVNGSFCSVVAKRRVILKFLVVVVDWGSIGCCVIFDLGGAVSRCSVGFGVVSYRISVVFQVNLVRRSSRWVVILRLLSCDGGARCRVVLGHFGVVFASFSGVISRNLGVVAGNRVVLGSLGVVGRGSLRSRVILRYLGGAARGSASCGVIL
jgi:hypothetical protein